MSAATGIWKEGIVATVYEMMWLWKGRRLEVGGC
jgi:hypothetical protein